LRNRFKRLRLLEGRRLGPKAHQRSGKMLDDDSALWRNQGRKSVRPPFHTVPIHKLAPNWRDSNGGSPRENVPQGAYAMSRVCPLSGRRKNCESGLFSLSMRNGRARNKTMNMAMDSRRSQFGCFSTSTRFFASCEQQDNPSLQWKTDHRHNRCSRNSTSANCGQLRGGKRLGSKRATRVPGKPSSCVHPSPSSRRGISAMPFITSAFSKRSTHACLVEKVMSIDELACKLMGKEREIPKRP